MAGKLTRRSLLKYGAWGLAGSQLGCWSGARDDGADLPPFDAPRNCLFIVLDAAAARHFGSWSYVRDTTPNIDDFAADAFVFRNAFSQAAATVPSVRSYFTSHYPNDVRREILPREFTLADAFQRSGFATGLFSENPYVSATFNYQKGFDFHRNYLTYRALKKSKGNRTDVELDSERMHRDIRNWIASAGDSPWFCYVHNFRPHAPYHAPEPYESLYSDGLPRGRASGSSRTLRQLETTATPEEAVYINALYDGNLKYCDQLIGQLLDWLEKTRRLDDTLVIIGSDHGEAFMQHGWLQHGTTTYDEMIHVPLIFRFPPGSGALTGETSAQIELLDLFPTLAAAFGFATVPVFEGESLLPLLTGSARSHKNHAYSLSPRHQSKSFAVRTPERKYMVKLDRSERVVESRELYDLQTDPFETVNLLRDGEVDEELDALLTARFAPLMGSGSADQNPEADDPDMDEHTRGALKALGYIR